LLSIHFNGPWPVAGFSDPYLTGYSLTPDGGSPVAVEPIDARRDRPLGFGAVGLFPHRPLQPLTWYTARATGFLGDRPPEAHFSPEDFDAFDVTWRFQTGPGGPTYDPRTRISRKPAKVVRIRARKARLRFTFAASSYLDAAAPFSFTCAIDRARRRPCSSSLRKRFGVGKHAIGVFATDAFGNTDETGASYKWRVKRRRG
jgi:hypothetical protein